MQIAIAGGTGRLGSRVADELRNRGHQVRILSRNAPRHRVDLTTGQGLASALDGCEVVVDASNNPSKTAASTLVDGSRRLLAAEQAAGVRHHVAVSIVGCERVPLDYFRVKAAQERIVEQGPVPWSMIRATQFHEYVATTLDGLSGWHVLPIPSVLVQSVACAQVATTVAEIAVATPRWCRVEVAGPEILQGREIARSWRSITHHHALLVPLPLPGELGHALRSGALTSSHPDVRGTTGFASWLRASYQFRRDRLVVGSC
jgi:uncharacterized protein YbjT (DUF2867 family)